MDQEWFLGQLSGINIDEIDIILISDPRSLYFSEMMLKVPNFHGIVLCTDATFRIGRAFLYDFQVIFHARTEPLPNNLSYVQLNFDQHFAFGNISIIPVQNGTGLGNCNWILTKGFDNELISYATYIVVGLWVQPKYFPRPKFNFDFIINSFCILPFACHEVDIENSLNKIATELKKNISEQKTIFIPSFTDDSIFLLMNYIKKETPITIDEKSRYIIYTFASQKLEDAISSFTLKLEDHIGTSSSSASNEHCFLNFPREIRETYKKNDNFTDSRIVFAPYPSLDFGQIIQIIKNRVTKSAIINCFLDNDFSTNNSWKTILQAINQINNFSIKPQIYAPNNIQFDERKDYPVEIDIGNFSRYWIDISSLQKFIKEVNGIKMVSGTFEGERVILNSVKEEIEQNIPDLDEISLRLIENGASNLHLEENKISFQFPFIEDENTGSIKCCNDTITIETSNPLIENFIISMLHGVKR